MVLVNGRSKWSVEAVAATAVSDSLLVMEVVRLRRRQEREVIAAVRDGGRHERDVEPEPGGGNVRAHQERPEQWRQQVADHVLQRVRVHRANADRRRPFVVNLVNVLVQQAVMEEPAANSLQPTVQYMSSLQHIA